jgi:hypothetical protein
MRFLTYSGNNLVHAELPPTARVFHPPPALPGIADTDIPAAVRHAFENPLGMPPLRDLVQRDSRILVCFDDNCQPFPPMRPPDIRQLCLETLLSMLESYGVRKDNVELMCAVALHRKMKPEELRAMVGERIFRDFHPDRLVNFDAEDPADIVRVGTTDRGEIVETSRKVLDADLVIYVDTIQIPLNGGHKSVAVGLSTYESLKIHHAPQMTAETPHVMQPDGSHMHECIERLSRVILAKARIMVLEAPMNGGTYPPHMSFLSKPAESCSFLQRRLQGLAPAGMKMMSENARFKMFKGLESCYRPLEFNAGSIDAVHAKTLERLRPQLEVRVEKQFDTLVFGLPDLSPYSVGTRINPVLVVSDVLGYIYNWFYGAPFVKKGGAVIILNPVFEFFHPEYHVAYRRFYDEVLAATHDPFEMQTHWQDRFARDPDLVDAYRNRWAHHGFHPFTVWYWATYPMRHLSKVILVGPPNDTSAKRLGVSWAPNLKHALGMAREATGGEDVVALSIPPFMYLNVAGNGRPHA